MFFAFLVPFNMKEFLHGRIFSLAKGTAVQIFKKYLHIMRSLQWNCPTVPLFARKEGQQMYFFLIVVLNAIKNDGV